MFFNSNDLDFFFTFNTNYHLTNLMKLLSRVFPTYNPDALLGPTHLEILMSAISFCHDHRSESLEYLWLQISGSNPHILERRDGIEMGFIANMDEKWVLPIHASGSVCFLPQSFLQDPHTSCDTEHCVMTIWPLVLHFGAME